MKVIFGWTRISPHYLLGKELSEVGLQSSKHGIHREDLFIVDIHLASSSTSSTYTNLSSSHETFHFQCFPIIERLDENRDPATSNDRAAPIVPHPCLSQSKQVGKRGIKRGSPKSSAFPKHNSSWTNHKSQLALNNPTSLTCFSCPHPNPPVASMRSTPHIYP